MTGEGQVRRDPAGRAPSAGQCPTSDPVSDRNSRPPRDRRGGYTCPPATELTSRPPSRPGNPEAGAPMRAIIRERYGSPDVVTVAEIDKPVPGPDQVLVRVRAASMNTADLDYLTGHPPIARVAFG